MAISETRLAELRAMPYEEYLKSPEWQVTRKRILKRDNYQCKGCHAKDVLFNIHHYTYERLGAELDEDLVTLCEFCHAELHRKLVDPPRISFMQKCGIGLGAAAVGTIGIEGFLQAPLPAEIGVLIGAVLLAKNSPAIYAKAKEIVPPEVLSWLGNAPTEKKQGKPSMLDIWLGRVPQKGSVIEEDEEEEVDDTQIADYLRRNGVKDEAIGEWLGRQEREDVEPEGSAYDREDEAYEEEEIPSFRPQPSSFFCFSELLKSGWRPSWRQIFVGRDMSGHDIFVPAEDLCHVALAGKTGGGKGSLMRLIMVQLCYVGAAVTLLNPHYMRWVRAKDGEEFDEDWSPFEGNHPKSGKPYLKMSPIEGAEFRTIYEYLAWAVDNLLQKRILEGRKGGVRFRPHFIVIDEWPAILGELGKAVAGYLGKLLREGRKFGIFVMVASQDFQVKTMGVEGEGGVRKCFLSVYYTGGDTTTRRELLNEVTRETPENKIGKGVVLMRCTGTANESILARVPFVDNESVYLLLGSSTFHKAKGAEPEVVRSGNATQMDVAPKGMSTLTLETVTAWFDTGRINEKQFFALVSQLPVAEPERSEPDDPFDSQEEESQAVAYVPPPKLLRPTWKYEEYYPIAQEAYRLGYASKRKLADFIRDHGQSFQVEQVGEAKALQIINEMQKRGMLQGDGAEEAEGEA